MMVVMVLMIMLMICGGGHVNDNGVYDDDDDDDVGDLGDDNVGDVDAGDVLGESVDDLVDDHVDDYVVDGTNVDGDGDNLGDGHVDEHAIGDDVGNLGDVHVDGNDVNDDHVDDAVGYLGDDHVDDHVDGDVDDHDADDGLVMVQRPCLRAASLAGHAGRGLSAVSAPSTQQYSSMAPTAYFAIVCPGGWDNLAQAEVSMATHVMSEVGTPVGLGHECMAQNCEIGQTSGVESADVYELGEAEGAALGPDSSCNVTEPLGGPFVFPCVFFS